MSYGWGDRETIRWDRAESRYLSADKFRGILGSSSTELQVSLVSHMQSPDDPLSHQHGAAFVLNLHGTHVVTFVGRVVTLGPFEAVNEELGVGPYLHRADGGIDLWYSIALRTSEATAVEIAAMPGSELKYATAMLPTTAHESNGGMLRLVTIEPGGSSSIRRPEGVLVAFVLDGDPSIRTGSSRIERIPSGAGRWYTAEQPTQWINDSRGPAHVLERYVAHTGDAFRPGIYVRELKAWP